MVGTAGYEGITCALVLLGFCLCLSRSFAFVCVSLARFARLVFSVCLLVSAVVRLVSDERLSVSFGRGVVLADASI
jgi:hypothetical protein